MTNGDIIGTAQAESISQKSTMKYGITYDPMPNARATTHTSNVAVPILIKHPLSWITIANVFASFHRLKIQPLQL